MFVEYNKKNIPEYKGEMHSVKFSHLGPRLRKDCAGNTVQIFRFNLNAFNRDQEVLGFCRGCGFIGKVRKS